MGVRWVKRHDVVGREVLDRKGEFVGSVRDTIPADGGGEVELLLVDVGRRFARRRYVPLRGTRIAQGCVHLPMLRWEVDDSPCADDRRWADPVDVARGYWIRSE